MVEALSTNLFRVMQCDLSALLLPDAESGELRVTILYNPEARGPCARDRSCRSMVRSRVRYCGPARASGSITSNRYAMILKVSGIREASVFMSA